jgi:thiamine biosynthesis lipoprotein
MRESAVRRTRPAMGTRFEVLLRGDDEVHLAAVAESILDEVERIEQLLSRFDPRSEISRINRLAAQEPVQVDYELAALLQTCFDARRATDGAFDITATSRCRERPPWRSANVPTKTALSGIAFDAERRLIRLDSSEVAFDLGGIGKGYALDRAAELLAEYGIKHALLHGGTSSILARGCDENGHPWRVALQGAGPTTVLLNDEALSCSAVNEQADIVVPATGQPLVEPRGVAVVAATATEAEILSTALLCFERNEAERFVVANRLRVHWIEPAPAPLSGSC